MGGSPDQVPDRYELADPMAAIPLAASVVLIHGRTDDRVPWQQSDEYATAATAAGAAARCVLLPETGHFELIDPLSGAWPAVLAEFRMAAGFGSHAVAGSRVCSAGAVALRVIPCERRRRAPLAQSAERLHGKEKVYGSIP